MVLKVIELAKSFDGVVALDHVSFEVNQEIFTLLGPSGCGKTTTLRIVAGLETADYGELWVDNTCLFSADKKIFVAPEKRGVGMVFQSYAVWPHMNVFKNVAFPLHQRNTPKTEIEQRVKAALDLVNLGGLENRYVFQLSGGQQQRVSLARALVYNPSILLLDEPLSNLDAKLREQMRLELKLLMKRLRITVLYVTHDQEEALAISDKIGIMKTGNIIQIASPKEIYQQPESEFVADFIGSTNLIKGKIIDTSVDGKFTVVETSLGRIHCVNTNTKRHEEVVISVRPENIDILKSRPDQSTNLMKAEVKALTYLGKHSDYRLLVGEQIIRAFSHLTFNEKEIVWLVLDPDYCKIIKARD